MPIRTEGRTWKANQYIEPVPNMCAYTCVVNRNIGDVRNLSEVSKGTTRGPIPLLLSLPHWHRWLYARCQRRCPGTVLELPIDLGRDSLTGTSSAHDRQRYTIAGSYLLGSYGSFEAGKSRTNRLFVVAARR